MIAYNKEWLKHLGVQEAAGNAFAEDMISKPEADLIKERYPVGFYTPNVFIRIGLFLLTVIILFFTFGLLGLLFINAIDSAIGGLAIFFGLLAYGGLEYMVQSKNHYQSGVDDALLWISAGFLFGGISYLINAGSTANCWLALMFSIFYTLRFADRVMAIIVYCSLAGLIFFTFSGIGNLGKALMPFILMAMSALTYFLTKWIGNQPASRLYTDCLQVIAIAALLGFYIAGNYFVVRELSNSMFDLNLPDNASIPFGWLFWIFTFTIPVIYLFAGIKRKDGVLIRVGLVLVAVLVFTVRYYYHLAPLEVTMTLAGIILLSVAYLLTQYLKTPRQGFTSMDLSTLNEKGKLNIESLVLAETFGAHETGSDSTKFGGGDFGGGGSSADF